MKSPREISNEHATRIGFSADGMVALTIEAAILEALTQDGQLQDERLFLPVGAVRRVTTVLEAQLAAIRAACNGDLQPEVDTETLVRNLYHENVSLRYAATGLAGKVKASEGAQEA